MRSCLWHGLSVRKCPPRAKLRSIRACQQLLSDRSLWPCHHVRQSPGTRSFAHHEVLPTLSAQTGAASGNDDATIYALSTAPGRSAIAIIRISGSACMAIYEALCPGRPLPKPRKATLRTLYDPCPDIQDKSLLDVLDPGALLLYFPGPRTVTGEDVLELHVHGGPAIVKAVLAAISKAINRPSHSSDHVVRYAEPGEFTRRAFYNNRLDLAGIEALGDTLTADTEQQRRLAVNSTNNGLAKRYEAWRQQLLHARGELEALIDFSEDQHFEESPTKLVTSVAKQVEQLSLQVQASIQNASRGELLRSGISIALLGAPNAGKSSLLNLIVGREAAIVSKEVGTTRDVVEVGVDVGGYYCRFSDLAGLRGGSPQDSSSADEDSSRAPCMSEIGGVEEEGIRRAKERALAADIVIVVLQVEVTEKSLNIKVSSELRATIANCNERRQKMLYMVNKLDLLREHGYDRKRVRRKFRRFVRLDPDLRTMEDEVTYISCEDARLGREPLSDPGRFQYFLGHLTRVFKKMTSAVAVDSECNSRRLGTLETPLGATERQRLLLQQCLDHLNAFVFQVEPSRGQTDTNTPNADVDVVLAAESLRAAADCLAKITGKGESGNVEEVLGVVFEKFCVGK